MVKKINILWVSILLLTLLPVKAQQYIWTGDFTPANGIPPTLPAGWTSIETEGATGHWVTRLNGNYELYCQEKGQGSPATYYDPVKEEYVITPNITLPADDTYGVRFLWNGQAIGVLEKGAYDLHLAVTEDNGQTWNRIWSASNQEDVEKSGVLFPWTNWAGNLSTVSLKQYSGKTIKIAFIYELIEPESGNMVSIKSVGVLQHEAIEDPIVGGTSSYTFEDTYVGVKQKSTELYLVNQGIGSLEVLAIEGLEGTDYSTNLTPGTIGLTAQQVHNYQVYYTPTESGAAQVTMTIKTNGGDHQVRLNGTKKALPGGYVFESFEGYEYPPVGWEERGGWKLTSKARSGDYGVSAYFVSGAYLTSPTFDLTGDAEKYILEFEYAVELGEDDYAPENTFFVQQSNNGGIVWNTIWTNRKEIDSSYEKVTLELTKGSDNVCVRWVYTASISSWEDVSYSAIYLDNILYPAPKGANEKPQPVTTCNPTNGSKDQSANNLTLSWSGVLHAEGYKLYVGTDPANPVSFLNGEVVLANQLPEYILEGLEYETTYYWKVVPYNSYGEAENVTTWNFTTAADHTIRTFPYFYGFEDGIVTPLGWVMEGYYDCRWTISTNAPYEGNYSVNTMVYGEPGSSWLQMPEIYVPEDRGIQISFVWGNSMTTHLSREEGNNDYMNNGHDSVWFEVKIPEGDWERKAFCSQAADDKRWVKQKVILDDAKYRGKRITARWHYDGTYSVPAKGAALDNVEVSYVNEGGVPVITYMDWYAGERVIYTEWNAGIVNYKEMINPGEIFTLTNEGETDLEIKSVKFNTDFFTGTLAQGLKVKANDAIKFGLVFMGIEGNESVEDILSVEFTDGQIAEFPLKGIAIAKNNYCFTFEEDEAFSTTSVKDWKLYDEDGMQTNSVAMVSFPGVGSAYAYMVMNWEEANWPGVTPRSGKQVLMASGPTDSQQGISPRNWLISQQLTPLEGARLRFYARSYSYWGPHSMTVLVSTTDDKVTSFTALPEFVEIEVPVSENYIEYEADLSQYYGKQIYVALLHKTQSGFMMFMDDIYLENFVFGNSESSPPIFLTDPNENGEVGKEYTYNYSLIDPDDDPIFITVRGIPNWMTHTDRENGGILSGTPTEAGTYFIKIEATDGIYTVAQEFDILVIPPVGIDEKNMNFLTIYPNPVTNVLTIEGNYQGTVNLFDVTGKKVIMESNVNTLSVEELQDGVYILKINTEAGTYTTRIIKK